MNLTALVWLTLFVGLSLASLRRPAYAALVQLMTFFAAPAFWWFGNGLLNSLTMRWSLVAAIILGIANLVSWSTQPPATSASKRYMVLLALIVINAFLVDSVLAAYPPESNKVFDILWKGCLASFLILLSLRDQKDLELMLIGIVMGCGFASYEIVLGGEGRIEGGRLEGFQFPGAQGSNGGSAVLSLGLPIAGYFIISMHNRIYTVVSLLCAPLILESILRCNSRGAYLGLIAAGVVILISARGASRKRAILLCALGGAAILLLAKNEAIWARFNSIFAEAEQRDNSAAQRLLYWEAALKMISDYPLGSGGEAAFTSPRGLAYIQHFRDEFRSVHNGPLDVAAGWGVQGLFLLLTLLGSSAWVASRAAKIDLRNGNINRSLIGAVLLALLAGQFVCSMFTSVLDGEWFLWLATCCVVYARIVEQEVLEDDEVEGTIEDAEVEALEPVDR